MRASPILLLALAASAQAGFSCVDPSDALAHRWVQDQPCKLPMYQLPDPGVSGTTASPRWQAQLPAALATDAGHAMFWRFPVQPLGPQGAPRHSWR